MAEDRDTIAEALAAGRPIVRAGDWLSARVGEELVMMSALTGRYIGLSETGSRIWDLLETPLGFDALCARLMEEYDAAPGQVAAEVRDFICVLVENGIVSLDSAPAA